MLHTPGPNMTIANSVLLCFALSTASALSMDNFLIKFRQGDSSAVAVDFDASTRPAFPQMPRLAGCMGFECLKKYMALPDPVYSWRDTHQRLYGVEASTGTNWTGSILEMTSQSWLTDLDTDSHIWKHWLVLVMPSNSQASGTDWCTLFVGNGGNSIPVDPSDQIIRSAAVLAVRTGTLAAALFQVPNQPTAILSTGESGLREDQLKSRTWQQFLLQNVSSEWPIEFPDMKAVVRAMDTITSFTNRTQRFGITGASKRGIASYMAGAVDSRIVAIVPMVHPVEYRSNIEAQIRSYGHPSEVWGMVGVYLKLNLFQRDLAHDRLFAVVDPYYYMDHLKVPKLVIMATGDEFFILDNLEAWYPRLPGEKSFNMIPGSPHIDGAADKSHDFLIAAAAFFENHIHGQATPQIEWLIDNTSGTITAQQVSNHTPVSVRLWQADSCSNGDNKRDFRQKFCLGGAIEWTHSSATVINEGRSWAASVSPRADGRWTAFFLQFEYAPVGPQISGVQLSTGVSIVPLSYPF